MFAVDKEINLMKAIDHPHIVKYFGHFSNDNADICYILMEYCEVFKCLKHYHIPFLVTEVILKMYSRHEKFRQ